jgi:hypothetical protein
VIVKKGKINFEKCPLCPVRFDILNIRVRENKSHRKEGALTKRAFRVFGTFGASKTFTTEDTEGHRGTLSRANELGIGAR